MPTPAADTDAYVSPKRRRNQYAAPRQIVDAATPRLTRATGPIQPRFTASTKKNTIPSSITPPPVHARARAPNSTDQSTSTRSRSGAFHSGSGSDTSIGFGSGSGAAGEVQTN